MFILVILLWATAVASASSIFEDFDSEYGENTMVHNSGTIDNLAEFFKEIGWEEAVERINRNDTSYSNYISVTFRRQGNRWDVNPKKPRITIDLFRWKIKSGPGYDLDKEFEETLIFGKVSKTLISRSGDDVMTVTKRVVDGPTITHEILLFDERDIKDHPKREQSSIGPISFSNSPPPPPPPKHEYVMNVTSTCNHVTIHLQLYHYLDYY